MYYRRCKRIDKYIAIITIKRDIKKVDVYIYHFEKKQTF